MSLKPILLDLEIGKHVRRVERERQICTSVCEWEKCQFFTDLTKGFRLRLITRLSFFI